MSEDGVRASVGFCSGTGPRPDNQDFAAALFGWELQPPRHDVIAVIADGIGGAKGGRIAAETAVRGFLDGFCDVPESVPVQRAAAGVAATLNSWIYAQSQRDTLLFRHGLHFHRTDSQGACSAHSSCRRQPALPAARWKPCLSHQRSCAPRREASTLTRALGVETELRLDYVTQPAALHDRYLLTSDGVHGALAPETMAAILRGRAARRTPPRPSCPGRSNAAAMTIARRLCLICCNCPP